MCFRTCKRACERQAYIFSAKILKPNVYIADLSSPSLHVVYPTETCYREGNDINQITIVMYTQKYQFTVWSVALSKTRIWFLSYRSRAMTTSFCTRKVSSVYRCSGQASYKMLYKSVYQKE